MQDKEHPAPENLLCHLFNWFSICPNYYNNPGYHSATLPVYLWSALQMMRPAKVHLLLLILIVFFFCMASFSTMDPSYHPSWILDTQSYFLTSSCLSLLNQNLSNWYCLLLHNSFSEWRVSQILDHSSLYICWKHCPICKPILAYLLLTLNSSNW